MGRVVRLFSVFRDGMGLYFSECVKGREREGRGDLRSAFGRGIPASGPSGLRPYGTSAWAVSSELRPLTEELAVPTPPPRLRSASEALAACAAWIVAGISGEPCPCAQSFSWIWSRGEERNDESVCLSPIYVQRIRSS